MTPTTEQPASMRMLDTPQARELADLAAIFDDLQTVLRCCERLVTELAAPSSAADGDVVVEGLWTTAVLSYARCFNADRGTTRLAEDDVSALELEGDVAQWHHILLRMRGHYANPAVNPRERFSVGATQDSAGQASGIAITSATQPRLDDVTVRQTGALAYALSKLVDQRITDRQETVRTEASSLSNTELANLPRIDLTTQA